MTTRPDPAPSPKKTDGKLSAAVLWNAVRHYPLAFAGLLLLTAVTAAGVWLFLPLPKHTAAMEFHIAALSPRVISLGSDNQADLTSYRAVQAASVKQQKVLNNALNQLSSGGDAPELMLQPNPLVWLDKYLQVDFRKGPEFMRVYLEGDNPDEMLAIIRAVKDEYLKELNRREDGWVKDKVSKVDDLYRKYTSEIEESKRRIDNIARTLGTTDADSLESRADAYRTEINATRQKIRDLQQQLKEVNADLTRDNKEVTIPPSAIDAAVAQTAAVQEAESRVAAKEKALADLTPRTFEGAPVLAIARAELNSAKEARDKLRRQVRSGVETALREKAAGDRQVRIDQKKDAEGRLERQINLLEQQAKDGQEALERHGQRRVELETLRKEIEHREGWLTKLAVEKDQADIDKGAPSRVRVHDEPYVAPGIEGYRRLRTTAIAGVGVFVVGFAALVWWELRGRRVTRSDELAQALGLPLLGTLPPWAADAPGDHGELVEAIDSTRTVLLHGHTADHPLRTLVVTSALPGEGKTSLAGHLAISLTRAGYRTLLVDGDVRSPSAHKVFDLPVGPGLCEVLRGEADTDEVVRDTTVPGLAVLPAGKWSLVARQALVGDRWATVRRQLERRYDFVVLDTPPLLLTTDSLLFARGADGVVLSVLKGVSRFGSVAHTQERLSSLGARVLGVVVSGARPEYPGAYDGRYEPTEDAIPLTPA